MASLDWEVVKHVGNGIKQVRDSTITMIGERVSEGTYHRHTNGTIYEDDKKGANS
jgi:hypothetical protein